MDLKAVLRPRPPLSARGNRREVGKVGSNGAQTPLARRQCFVASDNQLLDSDDSPHSSLPYRAAPTPTSPEEPMTVSPSNTMQSPEGPAFAASSGDCPEVEDFEDQDARPATATRRRVTFDEGPALSPTSSAQAAAKLRWQRQRTGVRAMLRRAERLTPRSQGWSCMDARGERRPSSAKVRAFTREPLVQESFEPAGVIAVDTNSRGKEDDEITEALTQPSSAAQKQTNDVGNPHSAVGALPDHVRRVLKLYHPQEEFTDVEHDGLMRGLAGSWGTAADWDKVLSAELKRVRTGDDVVAFFAKHGDQSDVKVIYCVIDDQTWRPASERHFRPYDLVVVDEKNRGDEFFMISAKGVVHVCPKMSSEHTSLSDWMHQAMVFSMLMSMAFFRHHLANKVISLWRSNARYAAYGALRSRLCRRLFLAKPAYAQPVSRIHSLFQSTCSMRLMAFNHEPGGRAMDLNTFLAQQKELQTLTELESRVEQVKEIVDSVLEEVNAAGRAAEDFDRPSTIPRFVFARRQQAELMAYRRRIRDLNRSLFGPFVRLVDVMLQSALVDLVVNQALDLLDRLRRTPKIFLVSVSFGGKGATLEFTPDQGRFQQAFVDILANLTDLVGSIVPLATSRQYEAHLDSICQSSAKVALNRDDTFKRAREGILERVEADFEKARRFSDQYFNPYKAIYSFGCDWDPTSFDKEDITDNTLVEKMTLMKQFEDELDRLKSVHPFGFILIESKTLRSALVPTVDACLTTMKARYRKAAKERCKQTLERFDHVTRELQARPLKLEQFMEFIKSLHRVDIERDSLEESRAAVEEMYSTIRQYAIRVELDEEVKRDALNQKAINFTSTVLPDASNFVQDHIEPSADEVSRRIGALEQEAQALNNELTTGDFSRPANIERAEYILDRIDDVSDCVNGLRKTGAWLNSCLQLLKQPNQQLMPLEIVAQECTTRTHLWEFAYQWHETTSSWSAEAVPTLDVQGLRRRLYSFERALDNLIDKMPTDPVVLQLRREVEQWHAKEALLILLANPAMKERHWAQILKSCSVDEPPQRITTEALSALGFFKDESLLKSCASISAKASAEHGLESTVDRAEESWKLRDLILVAPHPDMLNKMAHRQSNISYDSVCLGDHSEMLDMIESDVVSMQLATTSQAATAPVADRARDLLIKLESMYDLIHLWESVQESFSTLSCLFRPDQDFKPINSETSSTMLAAVDSFKTAEKGWRQVMQRTRSSTERKLFNLVSQHELLQQLETISHSSQVALRSLESFLEFRRQNSPRLYFVQGDQLLQVLVGCSSKVGTCTAAERLAPQLFPGIAAASIHCTGGTKSVEDILVEGCEPSVAMSDDTNINDVDKCSEPESDLGGDLQFKKQSSCVSNTIYVSLRSREGEHFPLIDGDHQEIELGHAWTLDELARTIDNSMRREIRSAASRAVEQIMQADKCAEWLFAWLTNVGDQDTVAAHDFKSIVGKSLAQVTLLALAVRWTYEMEVLLSPATYEAPANPSQVDQSAEIYGGMHSKRQIVSKQRTFEEVGPAKPKLERQQSEVGPTKPKVERLVSEVDTANFNLERQASEVGTAKVASVDSRKALYHSEGVGVGPGTNTAADDEPQRALTLPSLEHWEAPESGNSVSWSHRKLVSPSEMVWPLLDRLSACLCRRRTEIRNIAELVRNSCLLAAQRAAISAALLHELRMRDAIASIEQASAGGMLRENFEWQCQLRAEGLVEDAPLQRCATALSAVAQLRVVWHMLDWSSPYGCEYVGAAPRFVYTPETERNMVGLIASLRPSSLTAALAIAGPSGSGKSEVVREIASTVAVPLVHFSGVENLGVENSESVMRGLLAVGAWGLFVGNMWDITSTTYPQVGTMALAALAETMHAVLRSRLGLLSTVEIGGHVVSLPSERVAALYFVLRSASPLTTYTGKPFLDVMRWPSSFAALVRPLVPATPSTAAVGEALLYATGLRGNDAVRCGVKLANFLDLLHTHVPEASEGHRICDMRIIVTTAQLVGKRLELSINTPRSKKSVTIQENSCIDADSLVAQALMEAVGSSPSANTAKLLRQLMSELFPSFADAHAQENDIETIEFRQMMKKCLQERAIQSGSVLSDVGLTVSHYLRDSQAVVLAGGGSSGKSTFLAALTDALQCVASKQSLQATADSGGANLVEAQPTAQVTSGGRVDEVSMIRLFPDALPRDSFFGSGCTTSNGEEITGAVLPTLLRGLFATDAPPTKSYGWCRLRTAGALDAPRQESHARKCRSQYILVFDAEVDGPEWADLFCEALEPISRSPRVLALKGGGRIPLPSNVSLVFETRSLASASPAFCSRVGICPFEAMLSTEDLVSTFECRLRSRSQQSPVAKLSRTLASFAIRVLHMQRRDILGESVLGVRLPIGFGVGEGPSLARAQRFLTLLEHLLDEEHCLHPNIIAVGQEQELIELFAVYAAVWGLGGDLEPECRAEFGELLLELIMAETSQKGAMSSGTYGLDLTTRDELTAMSGDRDLDFPRMAPTPSAAGNLVELDDVEDETDWPKYQDGGMPTRVVGIGGLSNPSRGDDANTSSFLGLPRAASALADILHTPADLWLLQICVRDGCACSFLSNDHLVQAQVAGMTAATDQILATMTTVQQNASPSAIPDPGFLSTSTCFIPTAESEAVRLLCHLLTPLKKGFLLCGSPSSGKSTVAAQILASNEDRQWEGGLYCCPRRAASPAFTYFLERQLGHARRCGRQPTALGPKGPPNGANSVVIIDDVHLASATVPEALRQLIEVGCYRDQRCAKRAVSVEGVQFCAIGDLSLLSAVPRLVQARKQIGSRGAEIEIAASLAKRRRWIGQMLPIRWSTPCKESIQQICSHILAPWACSQREAVQVAISEVVSHASRVPTLVAARFAPHPSRPLLRCDISDLTRWCTGLMRATEVESSTELERLAWHELIREVRDRLESSKDQMMMTEVFVAAGFTSMETKQEPVCAALLPESHSQSKQFQYRDLGNTLLAQKILTKMLEQQLVTGCGSGVMPLVLVESLVINVIAVARALGLVEAGGCGGALVLGPGGCGKRSCAFLAARLAHSQVIQPSAASTALLGEELRRVFKAPQSSGNNATSHVHSRAMQVFGPISDSWFSEDDSFFEELDVILRGATTLFEKAGTGDDNIGTKSNETAKPSEVAWRRQTSRSDDVRKLAPRYQHLAVPPQWSSKQASDSIKSQKASDLRKNSKYIAEVRSTIVGESPPLHSPSRRSSMEIGSWPDEFGGVEPAAMGARRLAVLLCMNPQRNLHTFRTRLRSFPGLISHLGVTWMRPWESEALIEVAKAVLQPLRSAANVEPHVTDQLVSVAAKMPLEIPGPINVAPYVASLMLVRTRLIEAQSQRIKEYDRLATASGKLKKQIATVAESYEKAGNITSLSAGLAETKRLAAQATSEASDLQQEIRYATSKVTALRAQVEQNISAERGAHAAACQRLQDFPPETVVSVLGNLTLKVQQICRVILVLLKLDDRSIENFLREDPLGTLIAFDPRANFIGEEARLKQAQEIITQTTSWGVPSLSASTSESSFCSVFAQWTRAALSYGLSLDQLSGMIMELRDSEVQRSALEKSFAETKAKQVELLSHERSMESQLASYDGFVGHAETALAKLGLKATMSDRDDDAKAMSRDLASLRKHLETCQEHYLPIWQARLIDFRTDSAMKETPAEVLLGAFMVHYFGAFNLESRRELQTRWRVACGAQNLQVNVDETVGHFLRSTSAHGKEFAIRVKSSVSAHPAMMENAEISARNDLVPLLMDPADMARPWLLDYLGKTAPPVIIKMGTPTAELLENLASAAAHGSPIVIEVTDEPLPLALDLVMRSEVDEVPLNQLKLFLICSLKKLPPAASHPRVAPVNCDPLANDSLEAWLFDDILDHEAPEIAQDLRVSRQEVSETSVARAKQERKLVNSLQESDESDSENDAGGDDDKHGGDVLVLCGLAVEALTHEEEAQEAWAKADKHAEAWRPLGAAVAALYRSGACAEQWSDAYSITGKCFFRWLWRYMEHSRPGRTAARGNMTDFLKPACVDFVTTIAGTFFPRHRLPLASCVALHAAAHDGRLDFKQIVELIPSDDQHETGAEEDNVTPDQDSPSCPDWIEPKAWHHLCTLASTRTSLEAALQSAAKRPDAWTPWAIDKLSEAEYDNGEAPSRVKLGLLPDVRQLIPIRLPGWSETADELLLVAAVAPHLASAALRRFVTSEFGSAIDAAITENCTLLVALEKGLREATANSTKVLIVLTEEMFASSHVDMRGDLGTQLSRIAEKHCISLNAFSAVANNGISNATTAVTRARFNNGWVLLTDVVAHNSRGVWALAQDVVEDAQRMRKSWGPLQNVVRRKQGSVASDKRANDGSAWNKFLGAGGNVGDQLKPSKETINPFMLVLSIHVGSSSSPFIPDTLLASAFRVAIAPPVGYRARLLSCIAELEERSLGDTLEAASVAALHTFVTGRTRFRPLGWSYPYAWMLHDLVQAAEMLSCWKRGRHNATLACYVCNLSYGTMLASVKDRSTLAAFCFDFFGQQGPYQAWENMVDPVVLAGMGAVHDHASLREFIIEAFPADDASGGQLFSLISTGMLGANSPEFHVANAEKEGRQLFALLRTSVDTLGQQQLSRFEVGEGSESVVLSTLDSLVDELGGHAPWTWGQTSAGENAEIHDFTDSLRGTMFRETQRLTRWFSATLESLAWARDVCVNGSTGDDVAEQICDSLSRQEVPVAWGRFGGCLLDCGGLPLVTFCQEIRGRSSFLRLLHDGVPLDSYWLGGFLCPSDVLAGLLRHHARHLQIPPCELQLQVQGSESANVKAGVGGRGWGNPDMAPTLPWEIKESTEIDSEASARRRQLGKLIKIHGLVLVGASWETSAGHICDRPVAAVPEWLPLVWLTARRIASLPAITKDIDEDPHSWTLSGSLGSADKKSLHVGNSPVPPSKNDSTNDGGSAILGDASESRGCVFDCPVFRTERRGVPPILTLSLKSSESDVSIWARRDTALLLSMPT